MNDIVYAARWLLPQSRPPINGGWIAIRAERIVAIGNSCQTPPSKPVDLGDVVILPALVNAHTHLEFSNLSVPIGYPGIKLYDWIGEVIRCRNEADIHPERTILAGLRQCFVSGTGLVADIATTPFPSFNDDALPPLEVVSMAEVLGLQPSRSGVKLSASIDHVKKLESHQKLHAGISPHAPYSTPLDVVRRCVDVARKHRLPLAMHVAESSEERQLLEHGSGPFADRLRELQVGSESVFPWGQDATLDLLKLLALAPRTLVIHGNDLHADELECIAKHPQMSVVFCPRTHAYFQHPAWPLAALRAAGIRIALGTDSLASNPDLSLWSEVRWLLQHRQDVDWQEALRWATINGADALAQPDLGRIEVSAKANLLTLPTAAKQLDELPETFLANDPNWLR